MKGDHERVKRDEAVKNRVGGNDDLATAPCTKAMVFVTIFFIGRYRSEG